MHRDMHDMQRRIHLEPSLAIFWDVLQLRADFTVRGDVVIYTPLN